VFGHLDIGRATTKWIRSLRFRGFSGAVVSADAAGRRDPSSESHRHALLSLSLRVSVVDRLCVSASSVISAVAFLRA